MAISRGLRKKSRAKAELEAKKHALAVQNPAPVRRKKKKRKNVSDSSNGGVRLHYKTRKPIRNRTVQRQKRQAIKEKKLRKKQQYKGQGKVKTRQRRSTKDETEIIDSIPTEPTEPVTRESKPMSEEDKERLRQYPSNGDSDEEKQRAREEDTPEDSPWKDDEEWRKSWLSKKEQENLKFNERPKNYTDDIIYSTFDSLLTEMGGYDEALRKIVQDAIDMYGFTEAMNRLEAYMYSMNQKNTVFGIPLNYKDAVLKGLSRFAKDMWGRPLSVAEAQTYEAKLDYLWGGEEYDI